MKKDAFSPITPSCDTCRFWDSYPKTDGSKPVHGDCRRYAPRPRIAADGHGVIWPETYTGEWCGEWSEAIDR